MKYIALFLGVVAAISGYVTYQSTQNVSVGADLRTFISTQLAGSPVAGYVLSTDGSVNSWIPAAGGGSSKWTDEGTVIYPTTLESIRVPFIEASSTSATSTLPNLKSNNIMAISSAGLVVRAANNTSVVDFGVGNTANSLFLGGVNIDGATRLATSINGVLQATAGAVTATTTGTLTETATGLEFSATRALIGGSSILSLTSGYEIPLSASTTQWSGFYNTPSTRITAGTGLSWSGNTLNATNGGGSTTTINGVNGPTFTFATSSATGIGLNISTTTGTLTFTPTVLSGFTIPTTTGLANLYANSHSAVTLSGALDYITLVGQNIVRGAIDLATDVTGILSLALGGTGSSLSDPGADRIMFWDDSAGLTTWLTAGTGLSISGTTLSATGGGGTSTTTEWRSSMQGWTFPDGSNVNTDIEANNFHTIKPIWYEIDTAGSDIGTLDLRTASATQPFGFNATNTLVIKNNSTEQFVTVSGNHPEIHTLTGSSTLVMSETAELIAFATSTGFTGIELDWEGFADWSSVETNNYIEFVRYLSIEAHKYGLKTMIYLPPIWNSAANNESGSGDEWDTANSDGYYELEYQDFESVPVDYLLIAVYDYQFDYSSGRPNAPLKWQDEIINYAKSKITDHDRLIIGIPAAGYGGTTGGYSFTALTYEAASLVAGFSGATRDTESGELTWTNGGSSYFISDDESINIKRERAERQGIKRVSIWHIGDNKYGNKYVEPTNARVPATILGNTSLSGKLFDITGDAGTAGMVLQATGTSTKWVATSTLGITGGSSSISSSLFATTSISGTETIYPIATSSDFILGSNSTSTATLWFDTSASKLALASTSANATATIESSNLAQALRLGDDIGSGLEYVFSTVGDVILETYGAVTRFVVAIAETLFQGNVKITGTLHVATTTYYGATTSDALVIDGFTNSGEWIQEFCTTPTAEVTAVVADTLRGCGRYAYSEDNAGQLDFVVPTTGTSTYFKLQPGATGATNVAGDGMGINWASGLDFGDIQRHSPVMEFAIRQDTVANATGTFVQAGITSAITVNPDFASEPAQGFYVLATSTQANYLFACNPSTGATTYIDTGIATSTTATAAANPFVHFRIEVSGTVNTAVTAILKARTTTNRNMSEEGSCTLDLSASTQAVAPVVGIGKSGAGTSSDLHLMFLKFWYKQPVF